MGEQLDLTTPVVATRNAVVLQYLQLDWPAQSIFVRLLGSDGVSVGVTWSGAQAVTLMTALNSANLSVKSLQRRVLEQAVTDGKIPGGTVSGTAQ